MIKKHLAIAMTGAVFATSIVPSFAATQKFSEDVKHETISADDSKEFVNEVSDLLKIKYSAQGETVDSVYQVVVNGKTIDSTNDLENLIKDIPENSQIVVTITDKGHDKVTEDGETKYTSKAVEKYSNYSELLKEAKEINDKNKSATNKKGLYSVADVVASVDDSENANGNELNIKVVKDGSSKEFTYTLDDKKVDLEKAPLDKNDNVMNLENLSISDISKLNFKDPVKIPSKVVKEVTIKNGDVNTVSPDKIFDGYRLLSLGNEISKDSNKKLSDITKDEDGSSYYYTVEYTKSDEKSASVTVESGDRQKLEDSRNMISTGNTKVKVLAGEDRFKTAVDIAKASGLKKNIVLVNCDKIVDGLSATPFAKMEGAPILLTNKDGVPSETLKYMQEIIKSNPDAKIYIVGGKNVVSSSVEKDLQKLTKNIVRYGGEDRHETSVKVAEAMVKEGSVNKAYVVGANGEADAMSIAAQSAKDKQPILVSGFYNMSKKSLNFLKDKSADIIGGTNAVSSSIENEIKKSAKNNAVVRIKGDDRQDTNAKVIGRYYGSLGTLYVVKDGYSNITDLIDALSAGPLAADNGPILLGTKNLSKTQEDILKSKIGSNGKFDVQEIGYGTSTNVFKTLGDMLGW